MTTEAFLHTIFEKHQNASNFPSSDAIAKTAKDILHLLFPEQTKHHLDTIDTLSNSFTEIESELASLLALMQSHLNDDSKNIAAQFIAEIPNVYEVLLTDIAAILSGDPAAKSEFEVIRAYPGFKAICYYRIAHILYKLQVPLVPRILTEYAHSKTGIDIHPGAQIDSHFFIDHGTGIVIGETAIIGKNVKLYQGVTLGALSVSKDMAETKRHPTIENNVVIYSGATILGGKTIIGTESIIGGNVWLTSSVPAQSKVYHQAQVKFHS